MEHFIFAAVVVIPVFLLILAGMFLARIHWIGPDFIKMGSKLVFHLCLPSLLVLKISSMDSGLFLDSSEVWLTLGISTLLWLISWGGAMLFLPAADQGVFAQGAFRSNMAIIGIAIIQEVLGDGGVQKAAVYVALLIPLFNILSTLGITFSVTRQEMNQNRAETVSAGYLWLSLLKKILGNPLMIAIALGFLLFLFQLPLPGILKSSMEYLSRMSLPLALICIGGGIDFSHLKGNWGATLTASLIKVIIMPLLGFIAARLLGLSPSNTVVLVLLFGAPTAVSSFPMAQALKGNHELAANIVALTTLLSILTLGSFLTVFGIMGYLG